MRTCPDCHSLVDDAAIFCDNCGFRLSPVEREVEPTIKAEIPRPSSPAAQPPAVKEQTGACSSCGFLNMPGEMFCQNCGVQLAPVQSSPPPPPEPVSPPVPQPELPQAPAQVELAAIQPEPKAAGEMKPGMAECPNCGFQNFVGEKFCQNCGQSLVQAVIPQREVAPEMDAGASEEEEAVIQPAEELVPAAGQLESTGEVLAEDHAEADEQVEELVVEAEVDKSKAEEMAAEEEPLAQAAPASQTGAPIPAEAEPEMVVLPEPEPEPAPAAVTPAPAPSMARGIRGRLVVRSTGVEIPLPSGHDEITIGRVDLVRNVFPDLDMSGYGGESGGVSRMHARLVLQGDRLYIEDLNSTNYTFVNKLRLQPGQPYLVNDGDEIRLGLLAMIFHTA